MDIRSWGISQIVAATVVWWALLVFLLRVRSRRRFRNAVGSFDANAPDGVWTPLDDDPGTAVRRAPDGIELRFEERVRPIGFLLVFGPPIAVAVVRYVFLA